MAMVAMPPLAVVSASLHEQARGGAACGVCRWIQYCRMALSTLSLQIGQSVQRRSHSSMQSLWKTCRHGSLRQLSPMAKSPRQIMHVDCDEASWEASDGGHVNRSICDSVSSKRPRRCVSMSSSSLVVRSVLNNKT